MIPLFSPYVAIQNRLGKTIFTTFLILMMYQRLRFSGEKKEESLYFLKLINMKANLLAF